MRCDILRRAPFRIYVLLIRGFLGTCFVCFFISSFRSPPCFVSHRPEYFDLTDGNTSDVHPLNASKWVGSNKKQRIENHRDNTSDALPLNASKEVGSNKKQRKEKHGEDGCSQPMNHSILRPPFRMLQVGKPRTGSTFQFRLLDAIAHLKSPVGTRILSSFTTPRSLPNINGPYILKTHANLPWMQKSHTAGLVHVFSSGGRAPYGHYNQERSHLINCSMCEIKEYRTLFGLSCEDEKLLKQHMNLYEKLRRCCGLQMSKYRRLMLHGCDIVKFVDNLDYPHCEKLNLTDVELQFFSSPIPKSPIPDPSLDWSKPGDCAKFDAIIKSGKDFNGRPFLGCNQSVWHSRLRRTFCVSVLLDNLGSVRLNGWKVSVCVVSSKNVSTSKVPKPIYHVIIYNKI